MGWELIWAAPSIVPILVHYLRVHPQSLAPFSVLLEEKQCRTEEARSLKAGKLSGKKDQVKEMGKK